MKVLFATGRMLFPFFRGGDGTTAYQMLSGLVEYNIQCQALGVVNPQWETRPSHELLKVLQNQYFPTKMIGSGIFFKSSFDNYLVESNNFQKEITERIKEFKPDLIITQQERSEVVIDIAKNFKLKVVLYVHDCSRPNLRSINRMPDFIFYNSSFTKQFFNEITFIPSAIIYPVCDKMTYLCDALSPMYVTMVNPVKEKGLHVTLNSCLQLKEIPFQIVNGWQSDSSPFENLTNVIVHNFGVEMKNIYTTTKILIAPSLKHEAFCRVPVEAGFNGIPTIGSKVGGLNESVKDAGVLIRQYTSSNSWIKEISDLFYDAPRLQTLANKARNHSERFTIEKIIPQIVRILQQLIS